MSSSSAVFPASYSALTTVQVPWSFSASVLAVSSPGAGTAMNQPTAKTASACVFKKASNSWTHVGPNDHVQQRDRPVRLHTSESCDAGPCCCNGWFGPHDLTSQPVCRP